MKKIIITILIVTIFQTTITYAKNEETIKEQQNEFGIQEFLKDSKQYCRKIF